MKKPLKPARVAEDDQARHDSEQQRQDTLARLERALHQEQAALPKKHGPHEKPHNGDPYDSGGQDPRDTWSHGPKR